MMLGRGHVASGCVPVLCTVLFPLLFPFVTTLSEEGGGT